MNHIKLNDDYRRMLLESASWGKVGVDVVPQEQEQDQVEEEGEEQEISEEADVHVCPLCVSPLEEELDRDRILEHLEIVANILDRLEQINESEEADLEEIISQAVDEVLLENEVEEEGEEEYIAEEETEEETEEEEVVEEAYGKKGKMPKGLMPKGKMPKGKMPKGSC